MSVTDYFFVAFDSLRANVLRSILTALGIIIGVAAVIAMVSVGSGAQSRVEETIKAIGTNVLIITPGSDNTGGVRAGAGTRYTLTEQDAAAILAEVPNVLASSPSVSNRSQVIVGNSNWSTSVQGGTNEYFEAGDWTLQEGRLFEPNEIRAGGKVAIIGMTVANQLFPEQDAIAQTIRVNRVPLTVIGVLAAKGQSMGGQDMDDRVIVPISTAKQRITGRNAAKGNQVENIMVKGASTDTLDRVEQEVKELLRQRHRLPEGTADDFQVRNLTQLMQASQAITKTLTLLLGSAAGVALIVGGISIMNIMLVSVTERTREIGLRMAVGAEGRDILIQFVLEAVAMCVLGGAIGVVLGIAASHAVGAALDFPTRITFGSILLAFGFAAATGVFFGWYPARKAARLDPIEALRYE